MRKTALAILKNVARARFSRSHHFDPVLPTLYVTPLCNLRCSYCADWGTHRNRAFESEVPPLARLQQLARLLREECAGLYLTGGEPLMRPDIIELLVFLRSLEFRYLTMNTNALLLHLPERQEVVDYLDNLVISLDGLEVGRDEPRLSRQPKRIARLLDNVRWAAAAQRQRGHVLTVTSVVRPGQVHAARRVMEFCFEIGAHFSIQHLTVGSRASQDLIRDPEFPAFVDAMLEAKRRGRSISGSEAYLTITRDRVPFSCMPTAVPHVDHLGRLAYPCREIGNQVYVDLLAAGSLKAAMAEGARRYGSPPASCGLCPDRCYVETSALLQSPAMLVREVGAYLRPSA